MTAYKPYSQVRADRKGAKYSSTLDHNYDSKEEHFVNDERHQKALEKFKRKVTCYYEGRE